MNEQIYKLYREAWHWMDTPECEYQGREEDILIPDEFVEKFTELVVNECAAVINAGKDGWAQIPVEVALDLTAKNVKAYFGVK